MSYLTDTEKRLLLSALYREEKICQKVDESNTNNKDTVMLAPTVRSMIKKFSNNRYEDEIGKKHIDDFVKWERRPIISGFVDFCIYHSNGKPIYFVNGQLYAGLDMLAKIETVYDFAFPDSKRNVEDAIAENMYMFDIEETNDFYYPNDNMFSGDNSIRGIRGQILTIKEKYRV